MNLAENNRRKMKLLILCALVAVAAAGYQPSEAAGDKLCMMCGDPFIRTYDLVWLYMPYAQKTLMTKSLVPGQDCKIEIDLITRDSYFDDDDKAPIFVDWIGVGFWKHSNRKKYYRNWMIGQNWDVIGERGQTFGDSPVCRPIPWKFPFEGEDVTLWRSDVRQPGCKTVYEITRNGDHLEFRNVGCGCKWAIDIWPDGRNTCVNIWALKGNPWLGSLKGYCGNGDGDRTNDWTLCNGVTKSTDFDAIAASCQHGDHGAQGYKGGTRIFSVCKTTPTPP